MSTVQRSLRPTRAPAGADASPGDLAAALLAARVHRSIVVPRTDVRATLRLLSVREEFDVRAACRAALQLVGLEGLGIEGHAEWRLEYALRLVAIAVRHPARAEEPLADLVAWSECDGDQVLGVWDLYQDLQAELDPFGERFELSAVDRAAIEHAAGRGATAELVSYGAHKLARALAAAASSPAPAAGAASTTAGEGETPAGVGSGPGPGPEGPPADGR